MFQDERVPYGHAIEHPVYRLVPGLEWNELTSCPHSVDLWISETVEAPKYNWNVSGRHLEERVL